MGTSQSGTSQFPWACASQGFCQFTQCGVVGVLFLLACFGFKTGSHSIRQALNPPSSASSSDQILDVSHKLGPWVGISEWDLLTLSQPE